MSSEESITMDTPFFTGTPHIRKRDVNAKYTTIHYDFPDSPLNTHVEIVPKQGATAAVIMMHGLGDSADGMLPLVMQHYLPALHDKVKFIVPSAPNQPVTVNGGIHMPSWYDIASLESNRAEQTCDGIEKSRKHVEWILQKEQSNGIPANRIVIGGFSQGGALALYTGLQQPVTYAGILAKSGYLADTGNVTRVSEEAKNTPVHLFHGRSDDVVRHQWGVETADIVRRLGVKNVQFKDYIGLGHSMNEQEIKDATEWLKQILPSGHD